MSSIYRPVIDSMQWSYSRLKSFETCRYAWYLKYLYGLTEKPNFYASYGSFIHNLIEKYYRDEISLQDLQCEFLKGFSVCVQGKRPSEDIVDRYIEAGYRYFRHFKPMPYDMVDVEKRVEFEVEGYKFCGFVDYLGSDASDFVIIDHKSRDLKQRSGRKKPTQKDIELSGFLRQLYLYSIGIQNEYGKLPQKLCFNCFKSGEFIEEQFNAGAFEEAKSWAVQVIKTIEKTEVFSPNVEWFYCTYLCGFRDECVYYEMMKEGERHKRNRY